MSRTSNDSTDDTTQLLPTEQWCLPIHTSPSPFLPTVTSSPARTRRNNSPSIKKKLDSPTSNFSPDSDDRDVIGRSFSVDEESLEDDSKQQRKQPLHSFPIFGRRMKRENVFLPKILGFEWKQKLLKASTIASILCILDCTILPFVTIVLPLFGFVAGTPEQLEYLHELGHSVAIYFVLPVGTLATTMNYLYTHRKAYIAIMGSIGLTLILLANAASLVGCGSVTHNHSDGDHSPIHSSHDHTNDVDSLVSKFLRLVHHGMIHRVINLSGCALLLGSNYLSHKVAGCNCKTHTYRR